MTHTPGPWQVKNDYVPGCITIIANVDGEIIDGTTHHTYDFIATCEDEFGEFSLDAVGNARLIAAAPDLLAACIAFMPKGIAIGNGNVPDDLVVPMDVTMGELRAFEAAIAKAQPDARIQTLRGQNQTNA